MPDSDTIQTLFTTTNDTIHAACDLAIGVAMAAIIMIAAPMHPIKLGILRSGKIPGAQLPSIVC